MPTRPLHPLLVFLLERDCAFGEGAKLIGVSERALRDIVNWRRRFVRWREIEIAVDLGVEPDALFPSGR